VTADSEDPARSVVSIILKMNSSSQITRVIFSTTPVDLRLAVKMN
jgi:hypothetical protein